MKRTRKISLLFVLVLVSMWATLVAAESLETYAKKCDVAVGVTFPGFNCDDPDKSTLVPTTHPSNGNCDRPNRLNKVCDPGSRFTVLTNTPSAYVVGHCRKKGLAPGRYGDIAVIQHNRTTGATCFYQALGDLPAQVPAPINGVGGFWFTPEHTANTDCVACHDNGPIIRSPYLAQITGPNALPGAGDSSFNSKDKPYGFVGDDFAKWKVYRVEVDGNLCISCHRLGVNTGARFYPPGTAGTAVDFAIRATDKSEASKNPHSTASPIWMPPHNVLFDQNNANAAKQIHDCGLRISENPLPNSQDCRIQEYTSYFKKEKKASLIPIYYLLGI